jgi:dTDP-4-dehydrorhamnose reductase
MKVAVIGANGQLGTDVVQAFTDNGDEVFALTHDDIEVASLESVSAKLRELRPATVVNTAAMHHVESCEREPERAYAVNALGPRNLAVVADELHIVLVHVSTDYVFDGNKRSPYVEEDAPRPLNVYGNTKLAGEYFVRSLLDRHLVLRTSALYGPAPCRAKGGRNFIDLMLKLARDRGEVKVVDTEVVSPTSTGALARQIVLLSRSDAYGLFHATAEGSCSWYEFAREIFSLTNTPVNLKIAAPGEFPAKVLRPKYSVLENQGLKIYRANSFVPWQQDLAKYLGCSRVTVAH